VNFDFGHLCSLSLKKYCQLSSRNKSSFPTLSHKCREVKTEKRKKIKKQGRHLDTFKKLFIIELSSFKEAGERI
ncbi:hypothetical protein KAT45_00470, partial [Candidatus Aerophobetes bacterium]|nr:hypothetical protein [Candidatus Aerophobetes bacterium]